jgi:BON domain-containing protein/EF hand domain-containing protein
MKFNRATPTAIALAVAAALGMTAAVAQDKEQPSQRFLKFDKDGSGFITKDEVQGTRWFPQAFDQADDNKDGKLDQAEFIKADSIQDRMAGGNYVTDTVLKTKVKAVLLNKKGLRSKDLDVEVVGGEVLLSGFIRNEDQRNLALQAATSVKGVAGVRDAMVVK